MKNTTAILIGATGATGNELLQLLLNDADFSKVIVFGRNAPKTVHPKLESRVVDFDQIEKWKNEIQGDVLFSALGTTLKQAGSKDLQYKIDVTYQLEVAKAAAHNDVSQLVLVSSYGANKNASFFYPKIKGILEEEVKKLSFKALHIFQPPVLIRPKDIKRSGENAFVVLIGWFNALGLFLTQQPMSVKDLALKMLLVSKKINQDKVQEYPPKKIRSIEK